MFGSKIFFNHTTPVGHKLPKTGAEEMIRYIYGSDNIKPPAADPFQNGAG
jgi:hypothetical protein